MMKKLNFIISLVVYPFELMVSFGETDEEVIEALKSVRIPRKELDKIRMKSSPAVGKYMMFSNSLGIIRLKNYPQTESDYGTLAHEIFHSVADILDKVGIPLKVNVSDEPYAYLIGFLTKEIYKQLRS